MKGPGPGHGTIRVELEEPFGGPASAATAEGAVGQTSATRERLSPALLMFGPAPDSAYRSGAPSQPGLLLA